MTHIYTPRDLRKLNAVFTSSEAHPCLYRVHCAHTAMCSVCGAACWNAPIALDECAGTIKAIALNENEFYHRCDLHTVSNGKDG